MPSPARSRPISPAGRCRHCSFASSASRRISGIRWSGSGKMSKASRCIAASIRRRPICCTASLAVVGNFRGDHAPDHAVEHGHGRLQPDRRHHSLWSPSRRDISPARCRWACCFRPLGVRQRARRLVLDRRPLRHPGELAGGRRTARHVPSCDRGGARGGCQSHPHRQRRRRVASARSGSVAAEWHEAAGARRSDAERMVTR